MARPEVGGKAPPRGLSVTGPATYTVPEFCEAHRISVTALYAMWAKGEGPESMRVGSRRLLSLEAAARWLAAMETAE